jgi:hypothetical protein
VEQLSTLRFPGGRGGGDRIGLDGPRSRVEDVWWPGPDLPQPRLASKRRTRTWGTRPCCANRKSALACRTKSVVRIAKIGMGDKLLAPATVPQARSTAFIEPAYGPTSAVKKIGSIWGMGRPNGIPLPE